MSLYTNWACFNCQKSFHNFPFSKPELSEVQQGRKCPDCRLSLWDMGVYFEPPSRRDRKAWAIAQLLAENGYRYQTEGNVAYIKSFILCLKRPRIQDVQYRIKVQQQFSEENKTREKLKFYKKEKQKWKRK